MVVIKHGIGFSVESGARYIDMAAAKEMEPARPIQQTLPAETLNALPWSPWGKNNLLAQEMVVDIKTCGVLMGIIDGKSRFASCQGVLPAIVKPNEKGEMQVEKILWGTEVNDFLDMNNSFLQVFGWMRDYIGFHRGIGRIGLNRKGDSVVQMLRHDVSETRFAKKDGKGNVNDVWYSAEWDKVRGENDKRVFSEPLLRPNNPAQDLINRIDSGDKKRWFTVSATHPGWGEQYYPTPLWYAAYKWVKIAQGVPEMKAVMFENNLRVKYIVIIHDTYWANAFGQDTWKNYTTKQKEDARSKVYDSIDEYLVGSKNAYKSIFTTGYRDRDGKVWSEIEIKPVEDTTRQGELLPDSAAANSEIAFAMLWNNAMVGGNQASGLYESSQGGSNVRESMLMQVVIHEVERQQVKSILNVVKFFNGWNKKYPGLDFIIPATILTTLDTGAGSKQVMTGISKPKENA